MNKETQKRNNYNTEILNALENKYGVSIDYIRKCLRGVRIGVVPSKIISEYEEVAKQIDEAAAPIITKLINDN
ncbi:hypothetical protein [Flavobacterium kingsejongi]|uniref:Uncharacterized protein n=1 Tax=Flavobacterium kingsejongi TaxID=1678728 RepID=A0A2S1LU75_9FLAO|nr:hypothetical protein [Flavobacterium kingsejongi]AWG27186.1 hypothetical protein FK004_19175 [Flavobacterium kingsejongi]